MSLCRPILLVEDNPADVRLLQEAFKELDQPHQLYTASDGEEALNFIYQRAEHADKPRPDLILLDINLPKISGHQVLQAVKSQPELRNVPVLMLTSSDSMGDIQSAYDHDADAYLRKPSGISDFFNVVAQVKTYWTDLPTTVKSSLFWVNTPAHPRPVSDASRRVMGIPTPLHDPPTCSLKEVERSTTPSRCTLVEYLGDDGNSYYQFLSTEGVTWVVNWSN